MDGQAGLRKQEVLEMETLINFIFGSIDNPIMMAACFMVFLAVLDAVFSTINTILTNLTRG